MTACALADDSELLARDTRLNPVHRSFLVLDVSDVPIWRRRMLYHFADGSDSRNPLDLPSRSRSDPQAAPLAFAPLDASSLFESQNDGSYPVSCGAQYDRDLA